MTELTELSEGLLWAREITGKDADGRGAWCIIHVHGIVPFLTAIPMAYKGEDELWHKPRYDEAWPFNPNRWEFGPRIEVPQEAIV